MRRSRSFVPAVAGSLLLLCVLGPAVAFLPTAPHVGSKAMVGVGSPSEAVLGRTGVTALDAKKGKKSKGGSSKAPVTSEEQEVMQDFVSLIEEEQKMEAESVVEAARDLSPTMYDKLRSEASTPFRTFRLFVYAGFGVGASLGGFTAINELIASVNHLANALPLDKAALNVGVDVAVAAASAYAWVFESRLKRETEKEMAELRAKEPYKLTFDIKAEREKTLSALPVTFYVGENQTFTWTVEEVRKRGNQHVIVLAAPREELSEALLGARIAKALFAKNDVMIAPFALKDEKEMAREEEGEKKGFGKAPSAVSFETAFATQNYIAMPAEEEGWRAYVEQELSDAIKQGNDEARKKGIGIVMRKDGSIIRRGIGQPEWRDVVAELVDNKKTGDNDDSYLSSVPIAQQGKKKSKK